METKEKYLEQAEIRVKNLLGYLYESESDSLNEIAKLKERLSEKISSLEGYISHITKQRGELQSRLDDLKKAKDVQWEKAKEDLELQIKYVEGDRETFIHKAELILSDLGSKIRELEEKAVNAASDAKTDLNEKLKDLKKTKDELEEKMRRIKADTTDQWKEVKDWFIDKYQSIKERFSTTSKS